MWEACLSGLLLCLQVHVANFRPLPALEAQAGRGAGAAQQEQPAASEGLTWQQAAARIRQVADAQEATAERLRSLRATLCQHQAQGGNPPGFSRSFLASQARPQGPQQAVQGASACYSGPVTGQPGELGVPRPAWNENDGAAGSGGHAGQAQQSSGQQSHQPAWMLRHNLLDSSSSLNAPLQRSGQPQGAALLRAKHGWHRCC